MGRVAEPRQSRSFVYAPTQSLTGAERFVIIGFWTDPRCGGVPVSTNQFPVHFGDTQCYTWPGRSGENSASQFSCGRDSFSYSLLAEEFAEPPARSPR